MKEFLGNGYYYVNSLGHLHINKNDIQRKKCLNNGNIIEDKEALKKFFKTSFEKSLSDNNVDKFFCVTHDSFIDLIENMGFKVKYQVMIHSKVNINDLFGYWQCPECISCEHRDKCYVCNGKLPTEKRDEYLSLFVRK